MRYFLIFILSLIATFTFGAEISVLIYDGKGPADLGGYRYIVNGENKMISHVYCENGQLMADGVPLYQSVVYCEAYETRNYVNGRRYKGKLRILTDYYSIKIINCINVEEYIKGVLPMEVDYKWPDEALKAQAVAARTFALKKLQEMSGKQYHVDASHFSQVYGGVDVEQDSTNRAVETTSGMVMIYNNDYASTFYHASSGGKTASVEEVWSGSPLPYLKSVADPYSAGAPHSTWVYYIERDRLKKILNMESIIGIRMTYSASGRVKTVWLMNADSIETAVTGNNFRLALGSTNIRSTMFRAEISGTVVKFFGKGWGHGVGLSQWGAFEMALQGFGYKEILQFYYTGISIEQRSN